MEVCHGVKPVPHRPGSSYQNRVAWSQLSSIFYWRCLYVTTANIAAAQSHSSKPAVSGDSLGFPNVIILKDLNLADREIQIQVLEVSLLSIVFNMC